MMDNVSATRYPMSVNLSGNSVMVFPGTSCDMRFPKSKNNEKITGVTVNALDGNSYNVVADRPGRRRLFLVSGLYQAIGPDGETVCFEVVNRAVSIDFDHPPAPPAGVVGITTAGAAKEVVRYAIDGSRLASPRKGINIVLYSDGTRRKVLVR